MHEEGKTYLRNSGATESELAALSASIDQGAAWVNEAMPFGVAARMAAIEGKWAEANHLAAHISLLCRRIGITDPVQEAVINVLIVKLAESVTEKYLLGGQS